MTALAAFPAERELFGQAVRHYRYRAEAQRSQASGGNENRKRV